MFGRGRRAVASLMVDADHLVEAVGEHQGVAAAAAAGGQGPVSTLGEGAGQPGANGIGLQVVQSVVAVGQGVERLVVGGWAAVSVAVAHDRQGYRKSSAATSPCAGPMRGSKQDCR